MKKHDPEYYEHFHSMVVEGICCGLETPQEWIRSYSRCMGKPYDEYPAVSEFIYIASEELFDIAHMRPPVDQEEVIKWIEGTPTKPSGEASGS